MPSKPLDEVLADFDSWAKQARSSSRRVVLIELLAWQFASPVRWIETQDLLFADESDGGLGVERFVEIGLGSVPTVANLASQTLKLRAASATRSRCSTSSVTRRSCLHRRRSGAGRGRRARSTRSRGARRSPPLPPRLRPRPPHRPVDRVPTTSRSRPPTPPRSLIACGPSSVPISSAPPTRSRRCATASPRGVTSCSSTSAPSSRSARSTVRRTPTWARSAGTVDSLARTYKPFGPVLSDSIDDHLRKVFGPLGQAPGGHRRPRDEGLGARRRLGRTTSPPRWRSAPATAPASAAATSVAWPAAPRRRRRGGRRHRRAVAAVAAPAGVSVSLPSSGGGAVAPSTPRRWASSPSTSRAATACWPRPPASCSSSSASHDEARRRQRSRPTTNSSTSCRRNSVPTGRAGRSGVRRQARRCCSTTGGPAHVRISLVCGSTRHAWTASTIDGLRRCRQSVAAQAAWWRAPRDRRGSHGARRRRTTQIAAGGSRRHRRRPRSVRRGRRRHRRQQGLHRRRGRGQAARRRRDGRRDHLASRRRAARLLPRRSTAAMLAPVPHCGWSRPTWPPTRTSTRSSSGSANEQTETAGGAKTVVKPARHADAAVPVRRAPRGRRPRRRRCPRRDGDAGAPVVGGAPDRRAVEDRLRPATSTARCTWCCPVPRTADCSVATAPTARPRLRSTHWSAAGRPSATGPSGSPWRTRSSAGSAEPA